MQSDPTRGEKYMRSIYFGKSNKKRSKTRTRICRYQLEKQLGRTKEEKRRPQGGQGREHVYVRRDVEFSPFEFTSVNKSGYRRITQVGSNFRSQQESPVVKGVCYASHEGQRNGGVLKR